MVVLALLAGCAPSASVRAARMEGRYAIAVPGDGWSTVDPGGADHAWYNTALAATIYTDSNCGNRYAEARVEDLATELTAGLRAITTERDDHRALGGREGVLRVHGGTLDGVPVRVALGVVNRGACTYDLHLIAPPAAFDAAWSAYERVLTGFTPG